jgi:hypothetical protein
MIALITIVIVCILLTYIFEIFKQKYLVKFLILIIGVFLFLFLLFDVTSNSDWHVYESIYNGYTKSNDYLFNLMSELFSTKGYEYNILYQFHILLMGFGFVYFISRFSYSKVFTVITYYLLFQVVPLSNQIRYYVAFAFFLMAAYNLIIKKRIAIFVILAIISILSHSAILLMYPFIYLYYKVDHNKFPKTVILCGAIVGVSSYVVYLSGLFFSSIFGSYLEADHLSSLGGGLYSASIWFFWLLFIYLKHKRLFKQNSEIIKGDVKYQFLYKLSLYCLVFVPTCLVIQILSHRYILASIIIWLTFVLYTLEYEKTLILRLRSISVLLVLILVTFIYVFVLPNYIMGVSGTEVIVELFRLNPKLLFLFR